MPSSGITCRTSCTIRCGVGGQLRRQLEPVDELRADGVEVHRLPNLRALNIVLPGALGRGVADSTSLDPQGKSLGEYLRSKVLQIPVAILDPDGLQAWTTAS